ncbi:MAG: hypothetical protein RI949_1312 [Pseudomonadota bacterium]
MDLEASALTSGRATDVGCQALHQRLWSPEKGGTVTRSFQVDRTKCGGAARVNSQKSSTCSTHVERRIIRGEAPAKGPAVRRLVVDEGSEGQRLDNFLVKVLKGVPKTHLYRVIRSGEVRVNAGRAAADTRLALGDVVRIPPMRMEKAERLLRFARDDESDVQTPRRVQQSHPTREFPVLYEDDVLLAIDKPAGVAVHGGSGVSSGVIEQLRQARPGAKFLELVHRLDRETSGVLLVAKRRSALTHLQDQFRGRGVDKTYAALVWGDWPDKLKVIDVPLHKSVGPHGERVVRTTSADDLAGQRSITLVKVVQHLSGCTLLDVTIKTGRTHQIRVHLASQGHSIVGDDRYGDFAANKALARAPQGQPRLARMFLHARRLALTHPVSGAALEFASPLPAECKVFLGELEASARA